METQILCRIKEKKQRKSWTESTNNIARDAKKLKENEQSGFPPYTEKKNNKKLGAPVRLASSVFRTPDELHSV